MTAGASGSTGMVWDESHAVDRIYTLRDDIGRALAVVKLQGAWWIATGSDSVVVADGVPYATARAAAQRYGRAVLRTRGHVLGQDVSDSAFSYPPLGLGEDLSEWACNHDEIGNVGRIIRLSDIEWRAIAVGQVDLGTHSTLAIAQTQLHRYARDVLVPQIRDEEDDCAAEPAATTGGTMSEENAVKVKLTKTEIEDRKNKLVDVDREINKVLAEKADAMADFNGELKDLRAKQRTLLETIESGFEPQVAQTEAFTEDGSAPAPKGTSRPPAKKAAKKGAQKAKES